MHNEKVTMLPKGTISLSEYIYSWSKPNNASVTVYFKQTLRANPPSTSALHCGIMGNGKQTLPSTERKANSSKTDEADSTNTICLQIKQKKREMPPIYVNNLSFTLFYIRQLSFLKSKAIQVLFYSIIKRFFNYIS